MNDFDKTFVLAFYNSENKIKFQLQKYVNFKYMQFSKEDVVYLNMSSDLLIDFKDISVLKNLQNLQKYIMMEFTVKEVIQSREFFVQGSPPNIIHQEFTKYSA